MRIAASAVSLSSKQINIDISSQYTHLKKWDKNSETIEFLHIENNKQISISKERNDRVDINAQLLEKIQDGKNSGIQKDKDKLEEYMDECYGDIKLKIFKDLIEKFTGTEIKVYHPDRSSDNSEDINPDNDILSPPSSDTPEPLGWGIDYTYKETHYTKEGFSVEAAGKVVTDTGTEINFNTSLSMSRETYNELTVSIKEGDALIDPLVINFSGSGSNLSNVNFDFDLNIDGIIDSISAPAHGTGFLAYDKNGDGIINDGSELFGPKSNDGFAELAQFDDDNNGWIDENDSVFSSLSVWEKNADGTDTISKLLDRNVGAIYTGRVDTKFDIINSNNSLTGAIRHSGIWLNEKTGIAGIIQEIDLVI